MPCVLAAKAKEFLEAAASTLVDLGGLKLVYQKQTSKSTDI